MNPQPDQSKKGEDYLLLKWGTLKDWSGVHTPEAREIIDEYLKSGVGYSAMSRDDPEQKEILCRLVDAIDGKIQNDWDGEFYTKDQAKRYIRDES